MKIQFLGHSCFLLSDGKSRILVDPFLSQNPLAAAVPDEVDCSMIFVTHGHDDHFGDAADIARRTGAPIFSTVDVTLSSLIPAGIPTLSGNIGGKQAMPFGSVKIVSAIHGSGVPGALACGFIFEIGGRRIYHAGDTALTMDMALLAEERIDVALLPIGGFFTMGPEDALRAVKMIAPGCVIPMHFNTFPPIKQDGAAFCARVKRETDSDARLLQPGESFCC